MGALDPVGEVLGAVFRGFGEVVAEVAHHLEPHHVAVARAAGARGAVQLGGAALHLGVEILSGGAQLQQPRLVVDAGNAPLGGRRIVLHLQFLQQARHAGLHRVAQADRPHRAPAQHRAGHHRHRVGVVQQPRLRRRLLHVPRQVEHHRNGAQRAEDAADPQRVADGLAQAVALGHLEVDHRARLVTAHLNGVDHEVGAAQRLPPRAGAQVGLDPGAAGVEVAVQGSEHRLRLAQALGVDVVQGDGGGAQWLGQQAVADDVLDEHGRAGADEGDLHGA